MKYWLVAGLIVITASALYFVGQRRKADSVAPVSTAPVEAGEKTPLPSSRSTATTQPSTDSLTVLYSSSGFSPPSLTVKVGQTVIFENDSSRPMWVASNPHPVHTGLSTFDAKKNFSAGQNYSFTFSKVGSFGYHNHSNPSDTGTIVVVD